MTYQMEFYFALLIGGFLVVILALFALIWSGRSNEGRVSLALKKLGIQYDGPVLPLCLVGGFLIIGSGAWLWTQQYEERLSTQTTKMEQMQSKIANMQDLFDQFKNFDMRFNLAFPAQDVPEDLSQIKVTVFRRTKHEREPKLYELVNAGLGPGGMSVEIERLTYGDRIFVVATLGAKEWRSNHVVVPIGEFDMRSVESP